MKGTAILTALALTASAAAPALAQPDNRQRTYERDRADDRTYSRDRYERWDRSRWSRDFRGRWVPLATRYSARTDRQFIRLLGETGRFRKLRIEGVRGAPVIHRIAIEYVGDPTTQVVDLNTQLRRGQGEVIVLNGRSRINRIVVYSEPRFGGQYSVFGS